MRKLIYAFALITLFNACNTSPERKAKITNIALMEPPHDLAKPSLNNKSSQDVSRKIIKEGEISFETKNIADTRKTIYNSLDKLGGYIAAERETNDTSEAKSEYIINARIPEKNFELFLNDVLSGVSKVDSKNIRARDVTSDYIDITTHLADKKKLQERYVELLKKGEKMADLLEIENKISQIETSIDSTQGQLNYLEKQVEYSSLDITFYTKKPAHFMGESFGSRFFNAFSGGWNALVAIFFGLISIWPFWIIGAAMFFGLKNWRKKHPKKIQEKQ